MKRLIQDASKMTDIQKELGITVKAGSMSFENIANAISVVQKEMGITGTTAAEAATTISGSIASMKSAWQNLLVGIADGNQDLNQLFVNLWEGIVTVAGNVIPRIGVALQSLGSLIVEIIPQTLQSASTTLFQSGEDMIGKISEGLATGFPILAEKALSFLANFTGTLRENAGKLISSGLDMIVNLGKGIANSLPALITYVPTIVSNIANIINDNAPKLIVAAGKLILTLAKGLIQAIPTLVQNIPKIITAIVDVFTAFQWLNLGKTLISKFGSGITSMAGSVKTAAVKIKDSVVNAIKELPSKLVTLAKNSLSKMASALKNTSGVISAVKAIGSGIINAIKALPSQMLSLGSNIVKGLWNGISNVKSWILSKIKGFGQSILNEMKSFFGIKSPSTVMRDEVGKQLALGVAEGISRNKKYAKKSAAELSELILDAAKEKLDTYQTYNDMTIAEEVAFWDAIRKQCASGTASRLEADKNYLSAKQSLDEQLQAAEDAYQAKLEETNKKIQDRTNAILNSFSLFDEFVSGDPIKGSTLIASLQSQVDALEEWTSEINNLEGEIGDTDVFAAIREMGVSSLEQVKALNAMSEKELQKYVALYDQRQSLAQMQAEWELDDEIRQDVEDAWNTYAETLENLGVQAEKTGKDTNEVMQNMTLIWNKSLVGMADTARERFKEITSTIDSEMSKQLQNVKSKVAEMKEAMASVSGSSDSSTSSGVVAVASKISAAIAGHAEGGIMTKPTIFGYSPKSNTFHMGGEAGAEAIAPIDTLMGYVRTAVAEQNNGLAGILQAILQAILDKDTSVYLNSKEISKAVNKDLGVIY